VGVDVAEDAAEVVAVVVLRAGGAEVEVFEPLVAVSGLRAQREVPVALVVQRDVLERVERLRFAGSRRYR
jgi:hypothetical protein